MKALVLDIKRSEWETAEGMAHTSVAEPQLDEGKNPDDAGQVLIRPCFTGFCGSDKGICRVRLALVRPPDVAFVPLRG